MKLNTQNQKMSGTNEKSDAKIDFLQFKNLISEMKTDIVNEIGGSLIELKKELALVQNSIKILDEKQKIIEPYEFRMRILFSS